MKCYNFQGRPGYFSRGKFYPAIMGGSDAGSAVAAAQGMISGGTEGGETGNTETVSESQGSPDNSFANEVLSNLEGYSDAEKATLERYMSDIDGQITSRFQEIHKQYEPFKGMDPEAVQEGLALVQLVQSNPQGVFDMLGEALQHPAFLDSGEEEETLEQEPPGTGETEYGNVPQALLDRLDRQEAILESLAESAVARQTEQQEADEAAALDKELEDLHNEHGNFNEKWLLSFAAANEVDLATALPEYQAFVEEIMESFQAPKAPSPTLSGGDFALPTQKKPSELDGKQVKDLVAQLINADN